jgi:hypothetical protein
MLVLPNPTINLPMCLFFISIIWSNWVKIDICKDDRDVISSKIIEMLLQQISWFRNNRNVNSSIRQVVYQSDRDASLSYRSWIERSELERSAMSFIKIRIFVIFREAHEHNIYHKVFYTLRLLIVWLSLYNSVDLWISYRLCFFFFFFDFLRFPSISLKSDFFEISRRSFHLNLISLWHFFDALLFLSFCYFCFLYHLLFRVVVGLGFGQKFPPNP